MRLRVGHLDVDDNRNVHLVFRAIDAVPWERPVLDISTKQTAQDLLNGLHRSTEEALGRADGRSIVLRITLEGRGALYDSLRKQDFMQDLLDDLNGEWSGRSPFAWCERIEDETAPSFDRQERVQGSDFLAEVLKTTDRAKDDPELRAELQDGLGDLYQHRRYRRLLDDYTPGEDELPALIDEAEAIVVDLLAGERDA